MDCADGNRWLTWIVGGDDGGGAAEAAANTVNGGLLWWWKTGGEIEDLLKNTVDRWIAITAPLQSNLGLYLKPADRPGPTTGNFDILYLGVYQKN